MRCVLVVLLALLPVSFAIRCFNYQTSNFNNRMEQQSWIQCPLNARYCFKAHSENIDNFGQRTYLDSRQCGTPDLCSREGCVGNNQERSCCCDKDLCNSSSKLGGMAVLAALVSYYFYKV